MCCCRSLLTVALLGLCSGATTAASAADVIRNNGSATILHISAPGLDSPTGIAATSDAASYYVADKIGGAVYVFDAIGGFLFSYSGGSLIAPAGMDHTSDDGALYVASSGTDDVKVFTGTGTFLFSFTGDGLTSPTDVALTSDAAAVRVASRGTNDIKVFDAVGIFLFRFSSPDMSLDPTGIALTSDEAVAYVSSYATNTVEYFTATGAYLGPVVSGVPCSPTGVALTSDKSLIYVTCAATRSVEVFTATGTNVATIGGQGFLGEDCEITLALDDSVFAITNFSFTFTDCNSNGLADECDLACGPPGGACDLPGCGTSNDCNSNAMPDECEFADNDCNSNSIPDACDVQFGTSQDCQPNTTPDECELAGNDCDANGAPDECQLDCNTNGVADPCEIAAGTSRDCNTNGSPDECESVVPPLARVIAAASWKTHGGGRGPQHIGVNIDGRVENGDVTCETRTGGVILLRIAFCLPPGGPGLDPVDIYWRDCSVACPVSQACYVPYSGGSAVGASIDGADLVLKFSPGLENAHTYKFCVGPEVTAIPISASSCAVWWATCTATAWSTRRTAASSSAYGPARASPPPRTWTKAARPTPPTAASWSASGPGRRIARPDERAVSLKL